MMDDRKNTPTGEEEGGLEGSGDRSPAGAAGDDTSTPPQGSGDR